MNAASPVLGDFNGDGILDIATVTLRYDYVYGWVGSLTLLVGEKNGTFQQAGSLDIGAAPIGNLAVGDFNHDGSVDVASANSKGAVDVFLGNGDGTFQAPLESPAGPGTNFIAAGDFNRDGKLDLAAVSFGSVVQVLLGNGNGTFQTPVDYTVDSGSTSIAVADLNGDGRLDLTVSSWGEGESGHFVSVLLGKGDGTFRAKTDLSVGYAPSTVVAADLNGDGIADLATANFVSGTASVLLNKGKGTFLPAATYATGHPRAPYGIATVQFESGSKPGLVVATTAGTYILVNKGDGTFHSAQGYEPESSDVTAADVNGDGKADLVLAGGFFEEGTEGLTILFGRGHGVFASSTAYVAVPNLSAVAAGDFNGDGKADLAVADSDGDLIGIMFGQGKGRFSSPLHPYNVAGYPVSIAVGDFNGDTHLDLAVVLFDTNKVQVLLGNGDGTFTPGGTFPVLGRWAKWIRLADFNGDGILDIAVTSEGDYADLGEVSILLGRGDGTFDQATGYAQGQYNEGLAVADFDHDGKLDFAVANYSTSSVSVFLGNGKGKFKQKGTYAVGAAPIDLVTADFNSDGNGDLAAAIGWGGVSILLGSGDGTFQLGAGDSSVLAGRLSAADFDGDGKPDLAVVSNGLLYLLRGKRDGTFKPALSSNIGVISDSLATADLNGDGTLDLAVPNNWGGEVSVLLNRCAP
jgi:hypothetical protein